METVRHNRIVSDDPVKKKYFRAGVVARFLKMPMTYLWALCRRAQIRGSKSRGKWALYSRQDVSKLLATKMTGRKKREPKWPVMQPGKIIRARINPMNQESIKMLRMGIDG